MTSKSDLMKSCGITAVVYEVGSYDSAHNVTSMAVEYPTGVTNPMRYTRDGYWEFVDKNVVIPAGEVFTVWPMPKPKDWWGFNQ